MDNLITVETKIPIDFDQLAEIFEKEANLAEGQKLLVAVNYCDCEYKGKKFSDVTLQKSSHSTLSNMAIKVSIQQNGK